MAKTETPRCVAIAELVFGPDKRDGKWYFYAYVEGEQVEWGPYSSEDFALGAKAAIARRLAGDQARVVPPGGPLPNPE